MRTHAVLVIAAGLVVLGSVIALLAQIRKPPDLEPEIARDAAPPPTISEHVAIDAMSAVVITRHSAAREERETTLLGLRESGEAVEPWNEQATALFAAIGRSLATVSGAGCFIAGCGATLAFPSEAAYRRARLDIEGLEAFRAWTGGKTYTSPETLPNGTVVVGLVLYRPD